MKSRRSLFLDPRPASAPPSSAAAAELLRPSPTRHTVKTFLLTPILLLTFLTTPELTPAPAQIPAPPAPGPRITREEAIQRALERAAAAQAAASNAQARATNAPASNANQTGSPRPATAPVTATAPPPTTAGPPPITKGPAPTTAGPPPITAGPPSITAGPASTSVTPTSTTAAPAPTNASALITNRAVRTAVSSPATTGPSLSPASPATAAPTTPPGGGFPAAQVPPVALPRPTASATAVPGATAPNNAAERPDTELFPPGLIKLQEADLVQVLDFYQELTGRTVLRPASLPAAKVTIRSQTPLTRKEAVHAM